MPSIAFATYTDAPNLMPSDQALIEPLARRGITVTPAIWNDSTVEWGAFDAVIIRSAWDYHLHFEDFRGWIDHLENNAIPLFNPPDIVRWNMDKRYLQELSDNGVKILPTVWVEQGENIGLSTVLSQNNWQKAVIKPQISASAHNTWTTAPESAPNDQPRLNEMIQNSAIMIQRYAEEIHDGEFSLVFFNGVYSHTLLKRPAKGKFFVQEEYGGIITNTRPPINFIAQASNRLKIAHMLTKSTSMYARVDGINQDGQLVLMELELIEPELYVKYANPEAVERFADAIASVL